MAKKAPRKKVTRRLKRSVRKSLAAVLMITAIVVAAIPVPEMAASDGKIQSRTTQIRQESYSYNDDGSADKDMVMDPGSDFWNPPSGWNKEDAKNNTAEQDRAMGVERSLTIAQMSDGQWRLGWQFKFFLEQVAGKDMGVICDYNGTYFNGAITLNPNVTYEYEVVTEQTYNDYYRVSANDVEYELDLPDKPNDSWFFEKYFASAYNDYKKEYDNWKAAKDKHDEWVANGSTGKEPVVPAKPLPLKKSAFSELDSEQRLSYYCDIHYAKPGMGTGYTLKSVIDESSGGAYNKHVFVPKDGKPGTSISNDENGFMVTKDSTMIAIGTEAFKGITNVEDMTIPEEIKYIGDSAFEGSFMQTVNLVNVENIGNRAFKNASQLKSLSLGKGVQNIGTEAFYGTAIESVVFPYSIKKVGAGAFADCAKLKLVDGSAISGVSTASDPIYIDSFAFYNTIALEKVDFGASVSIRRMGKCAFAVDRGETGNLESFSYPQGLQDENELEDFTLAGRIRLKNVIMPTDFGAQKEAMIPEFTFYKCSNLESVQFPDSGSGSCGYAAYSPTLFSEVATDSFYVQGPKLNRESNVASPRESTWVAQTLVADMVPYVYYENGKRFCEISKDGYLMSIDENGLINTIKPRPGSTVSGNIALEIEEEYGGIPVTGLEDGAIDREILDNLKTLKIADNSIQTIGSSVFEGCPYLEAVTIGNAVKSIGSRAFANCPKLVDVTFHTPLAGYDGFTIGLEAFLTGSDKLMFHGDIATGYAPFEWAMNNQVFANENDGIRIAYQSLEPYRLTVILDNTTKQPTLVDYPHYNLIDLDNEEHVKGQAEYYEMRAQVEEMGGNTAYRDAWEKFKDECLQYDTKYDYSVVKKYEDVYIKNITPVYDFQKLSPYEEAMVDATRNIVVPEAVTSIDVYGFYNASEVSNLNSIAAYDLKNLRTWDSYTNKYAATAKAFQNIYTASAVNVPRAVATLVSKAGKKTVAERSSTEGNDIAPGLFSGNYRDYPSGSELAGRWETETKGNDRVETISLLGVTRLPDYAFDDCERLKQITLGAGCTDIGVSPFRGCTQLESVVFNNDAYIYENGIIYKNNDAGMLSVVTCLATRGNGNVNTGDPNINITTDPLLAKVNNIEVSAFDSCEHIANVDLTGVEHLSVIPRAAFKNCKSLSFVTLPRNITRIDEEAFYKDGGGALSTTIYGTEVSIRNNAFNHSRQVLLRSYKDSAAEKYADTYGLNFQTIDAGWEVNFMDYDGTFLSETQYIENEKPASVPNDPVRDGYIFNGWNPTVPEMSTQKITADVTFVAQYKADPNAGGNGNGSGDKPPTTDDETNKPDDETKKGIYTVTVINGSGSGSYQKGKEVSITANAPSTGRKFDRWETSSLNVSLKDVKSTTTTFTMPENNVVVTAVYDGGNGSSDSDEEDKGNSSGSDGTTTGTDGSGAGGTGSGTSGTGTGTAGSGGTTTPSGTAQSGTVVSIPNGIGISNTGAASATVEGSTDNFVVRITTTPEATAAVEKALTNEFGTLEHIRYYPMDISLYDSTGTTLITDTTGLAVNITIPLPDDLIPYAGNNKAGAVVNGDTLEKLGVTFKTIDGIPCINFTATHFSPYTIYVDTQNLTAAMDSSPKTGDPIHPKWFLALGLACLSVVLFMKKDKRSTRLA